MSRKGAAPTPVDRTSGPPALLEERPYLREIARATQAFVRNHEGVRYQDLVEAVAKWELWLARQAAR
jgi:hypothetical protein